MYTFRVRLMCCNRFFLSYWDLNVQPASVFSLVDFGEVKESLQDGSVDKHKP